MKVKKQFRLFDLYRLAAAGLKSSISGIEDYDVNKDVSTITVTYYSKGQKIYFAKDELELKGVIKQINKYNKRSKR